MRWSGALLSTIQRHEVYIVLGLTALVLILLVSIIKLHVKLGRLSRRKSTKLSLDDDLLATMQRGLDEMTSHSDRVDSLGDSHRVLHSQQKLCIQKVGIVKFNAFEDIGGEQSFALALLDADNNGVLLSSLLSRTESRTYAKAISAGKSEQVLSKEEQLALSRATKV